MDCLRIDEIERSMRKLNMQSENGETIEGRVEHTSKRKGHDRFTYYYMGRQIFTFGITRGSKKKETLFSYVPGQMLLNLPDYRKFNSCTMSKKEYNEKLIEKGKIPS